MCKPVSGLCNLDCSYCYYTGKPRELYPGRHRFKMSDQVLEEFTRQYLAAMPIHVDFGWQGGEPLLAGKAFFRRAVEFQRALGRDGQEIANALQTNGTLLDDEPVGISLDGPPAWHDHYRRDRRGQPTCHRAWAGVELLSKHRVEFNVLVTLNSVNAPHGADLYRFFVNRGINYLQFIPVLERDAAGAAQPFSCGPQQWGRFLLDVFDQWATRDVGKVSERFIDNVLHTLVFGQASMCCYAGRCANAHVLEFNGDLYVCDHFVQPAWRVGNIMERPLADLLADPLLERFAAMKTAVPDRCRDCEFYPFCRGGCPKHHVPIGTDAARTNWFCEGYREFFRHALPELRRMAEYFERNELPPLRGAPGAASDPAPRESRGANSQLEQGPPPDAARPMKESLRSSTPGRNDPCPCGSGRKYKKCCGRGT